MRMCNYVWILLAALFIMSCDKYVDITSSIDTVAAVDMEEDLYLSAILTDLDNETESINENIGADGVTLKSANIDQPFKVFVTGRSEWPQVIIMDYGEVNVTDANGVMHRGQIILQRYKPDNRLGLITVITYKNYYRNNNKIEGYKKRMKKDTQVEVPLLAIHDSIHVTRSTGEEYTKIGARLHTQIYGTETTTTADDIYMITGRSKIRMANGTSYKRVIAVPLIKYTTCPYYVEGQVNIISNQTIQRVIDYGHGECDDEVTILKGSETEAYILEQVKDKKDNLDTSNNTKRQKRTTT